ncbi:MAG: SPOR domain-containing protein [Hydrogenophaga sp.]|nr:SPOR domain-containing protein [Hydrogenophaga sp.]
MRALWAEAGVFTLGINPHARARIAGMSSNPPPTATAPESATTALYRAALGPVNTGHYLAVFERFDDAGRASPVWNPVAGLLTLNWLVFRQLWGAALVYLACAQGLALLVLVAARRFLQWPPSVEWGVLLTLLLLSIAIPGAYGNALLHADTRRRMTRAVREARTVREACAALEKRASSKRRLGALVVVNLLLAGALGAGWLGGGLQQGLPAPAAQLLEAPAPAAPAAPATPAAEPEPVEQAVAAAPPAAPEPVPEPAPVIVTPPTLPALPSSVADSPPAEPPVEAKAAPSEPAKVVIAKVVAPKATGAAAVVPQAHGINVGLFADPANADKAHARLVEAGFPAILQKVESPKGELTRVRVGPFASRATADEAAARIRALGLDAVVFAP